MYLFLRVISELTVETMDEFKKMFKMFDKVGSSIQQNLDMGDKRHGKKCEQICIAKEVWNLRRVVS